MSFLILSSIYIWESQINFPSLFSEECCISYLSHMFYLSRLSHWPTETYSCKILQSECFPHKIRFPKQRGKGKTDLYCANSRGKRSRRIMLHLWQTKGIWYLFCDYFQKIFLWEFLYWKSQCGKFISMYKSVTAEGKIGILLIFETENPRVEAG
jgi:hypothetical protein